MPARGNSPVIRPSPPVGVVATAVTCRSVVVAWSGDRSGGDGYRIERAHGVGEGLNFVQVGEAAETITAFDDAAVEPGTTYTYRVRARNRLGLSPPSGVAEVTTPDEAAARSRFEVGD